MTAGAAMHDWTPAALVNAVETESAIRVSVHGLDIVLWRGADGRVRAWENRCPHRGMRLSFGRVRGNTLACLYHGWTYTGEGACTAIPAHPDLVPPESLCARVYAVHEAGGLVWVAARPDPGDPPVVSGEWVPCRSLAFRTPVTLKLLLAQLPDCEPQGISSHAAMVHLSGGSGAILAVQPVDERDSMVHCSLPAAASTQLLCETSHALGRLRESIERSMPRTRPPPADPSRPPDAFTVNQWYAIGRAEDLVAGESRITRLLAEDLRVQPGVGAPVVTGRDSRPLPVQIRYGHVWTTLGEAPIDLYDIPEFDDPERRLILAGAVSVRCSGMRAVENFLDMAHFPFVHTGILGVEDQPEVCRYNVSMNVDDTEIWATKCQFFQPAAAAAATGGQLVHYRYRVAHPYSTILYKTCPAREQAWDLIGLFIQPTEEDACRVHSFVLVFDDDNSNTDILHFQQNIFLQDRIILENQVPRTLPIDPRLEMPTRADASSIAYRRWLKANGVTWGTTRLPETA